MAFSLLHIPVANLKSEHIDDLLDNRAIETKHIEYKRSLPPTQAELKELRQTKGNSEHNPRREFACDVAAMANSEGGDIIFGICGKDFKVYPIALNDWDQTRTSLEQSIQSLIEPKILGCDFKLIEWENSGFIVVLRVPKSLIGPHQVLGGPPRYLLRLVGGKSEMDTAQLRAAFQTSATAIEFARMWRAQRFSEVVDRRQQWPFNAKALQTTYLIPLTLADPTARFEIRKLAEQKNLLTVSKANVAMRSRVNADGFQTFSSRSASPEDSGSVQFYVNGAVESIKALTADRFQEKVISGQTYEGELLLSLYRQLGAMRNIGVNLPILAGIAFLEVENMRIAGGNYAANRDSDVHIINQNQIPFREILISEWPSAQDIPELFRSLVESLWNASGHCESDYYREPTHFIVEFLK